MSPTYAELIVCPTCHGELTGWGSDDVSCGRGHRFPLVQDVPVFTADGRAVDVRPADHISHQPPPRLLDLMGAGDQPWLHLGAGASAPKTPGSIELETAIFATTDIVGDAAALPFDDGSLSGALALNVFEHLPDPDTSLRELRRVVRPGGTIVVQTAFLQPVHADPSHYFNVTEHGLRRWFRHFDVESVSVPENFNPLYSFAWMASDLLFWTDGEDRETLAGATIADLAEMWRDPSTIQGPVGLAFRRLEDRVQRTLAAGFEIVARRPAAD